MTPVTSERNKMKNTLNTIARKVVENKNIIIKRSLIVAGAVAGLVLTAGIVAKVTNEVDEALELPSTD